MKKILILGATSTIAEASARHFAADGDHLCLVARNAEKLKAVADDLKARGAAQVESLVADLEHFDRHAVLFQKTLEVLGGLDVVLIAHGTLGDQKAGEKDYRIAEKEIQTNFLSVVSLLTPIASYLEQQKSGCIAVISSVAGDRARQDNYIYGTAKGAVSLFLQGLRNRLYRSGVSVVTIKPGFVDTPMTEHLKKNFLFASPHQVGEGVYRAIMKKKDVVYLPGFWRWIMTVVRMIPESLFKRLSL